MAEQIELPNPYLDDQADTKNRAGLMYSALSTLAMTRLHHPVQTEDFTAMLVQVAIGAVVGRREDESREDSASRGAKAIAWGLSLAVHRLAGQEVDFTDPDPVPADHVCNCGADHLAQQRTKDAFFAASVDGNPDTAVSVLVNAFGSQDHVQADMVERFGPMQKNHVERFYLAQLFDDAVQRLSEKMYGHAA